MTRLPAAAALILALAIAGCGGYGSQNTPATTPSSGSEPTATASDTGSEQNPRDESAALCETMRQDIGKVPSPKGKTGQVDYDAALEGIQETYTNRLGMLTVSDPAKLAELVAADQALFAAQADARKAPNPEEGGVEGGSAQADASATVEKLADDLDLESCASV
ncbi:MAG: hypothetical protein QOG62_2175 [Thermoleophilaceae bacterium]|jgi:hypothetical protein|nr:hypothetical protein [Thermoleophilaceae bacterium]